MMVPDPLRSAMVSEMAEDTSLALPSDNNLRTGQRRVLDQVHTIKRSKFKQSTRSPTGPAPEITNSTKEFGSFKFSPFKTNGTLKGSSSNSSLAYGRGVNSQRSRTISAKTTRYSSSGTWEHQTNTNGRAQKTNGLQQSRSDPALAKPVLVAPSAPSMKVKGQMAQGQFSSHFQSNQQSTHSMPNEVTDGLRSASFQSQNEVKQGSLKTSKIEQTTVMSPPINTSDMTLMKAVEFLSSQEESYQQAGASFIQHSTFNDQSAKEEVFKLGGIQHLVFLLRSPNPSVNQAAAGALRNLVFKDKENKMVVENCGGIAKALLLLKETESTETQKQVTGLLWNLSAANKLKKELTTTALPVLTEKVVIPFTSLSESTYVDPGVFHCATGCLRNLSCGQETERSNMRNCPGLIDSLMVYIRSCVAEDNTDDTSVENCACILHNLTYQLESECPESFTGYGIPEKDEQESKESSTVGCFSPRSSKVQKEMAFNMSRPEDSTPSGVNWLCHPEGVEIFLSLLVSSQKEATLEASCGALQNLTGSGKPGSTGVGCVLLQHHKTQYILPSLIKSQSQSLQRTVFCLLNNLSRNKSFQATLAKLVLTDLTGLLTSGPSEMGNSDETVAIVCTVVSRLLQANTNMNSKVITRDLIYSLVDLTTKESFPKTNKEATVLLHSLWNEKSLQSIVKKLGFKKDLFLNGSGSKTHK